MEKIKAVYGNEQHPELVKNWLKEQGAKEVTVKGDNSNLVYCVDNNGIVRYLIACEYDFLFDMVTLEKPKLKVIKGDKIRGQEVIDYLKSLGGNNEFRFTGTAYCYYYIDEGNTICCATTESDFLKDYKLEIIELPLPKEKPELKVVSGNEQYSDDVIATLKALGGINRYNLRCTDKYQYYFVNTSGEIDGLPKDSPFFNTCKLCILEIDKPKLKPFDKVLVRDSDDEKWRPKFFSHYDKESYFPYTTLDHEHYQQCIPYEENEYKLQ